MCSFIYSREFYFLAAFACVIFKDRIRFSDVHSCVLDQFGSFAAVESKSVVSFLSSNSSKKTFYWATIPFEFVPLHVSFVHRDYLCRHNPRSVAAGTAVSSRAARMTA
jgi:hypothetical protein